MTIHIEKKDLPEHIKRSLEQIYNGRTYKAVITKTVELYGAYWSGGSKTTYYGLYLGTGQLEANLKEFGNPFTCPDIPTIEIPENFAVVGHSIFCGKDTGITIYMNSVNARALLPEKSEITEDQKIVLLYTRAYKSSYNGVKNYRFSEANYKTGITLDRWNEAKEKCINEKLLNKRGAITPKGRNQVEGLQP